MKNSIGMLGDLMMLLGVIFIFLGFLCRRYRNIHAKYKGRAEATVVEIVAGHPKGSAGMRPKLFLSCLCLLCRRRADKETVSLRQQSLQICAESKSEYQIQDFKSIDFYHRKRKLSGETGKNPLLSWDFPGSCRNIYFYFICQPKMVDVVYHTVLYLASMN